MQWLPAGSTSRLVRMASRIENIVVSEKRTDWDLHCLLKQTVTYIQVQICKAKGLIFGQIPGVNPN